MIQVNQAANSSLYRSRYHQCLEGVRVEHMRATHFQGVGILQILDDLLGLLFRERVQDGLGRVVVNELPDVIVCRVELEDDLLIPHFDISETQRLHFLLETLWILPKVKGCPLWRLLRTQAMLGQHFVKDSEVLAVVLLAPDCEADTGALLADSEALFEHQLIVINKHQGKIPYVAIELPVGKGKRLVVGHSAKHQSFSLPDAFFLQVCIHLEGLVTQGLQLLGIDVGFVPRDGQVVSIGVCEFVLHQLQHLIGKVCAHKYRAALEHTLRENQGMHS